ncbi:MAG: subfamily polymerase sigma-24 factor [Clostridia bacterium]|nr:subfamily polymerase sigma-24 factor [Clostridia bacterium]
MNIDKSILQRCKKNDKNAFAELFKFYQNYLFKICFSYVQNEQTALDMLQEIYIKLYKNISKYDEKYPFHPWIRQVAVNTCLNEKRKAVPLSISLSNEDEGFALEDQLAAEEDTQKEVEKHDMARIIKQHINSLPEKQRMVIILRYYEDLSYEEISDLLKLPLGTVKTDLYRAKNALKGRLCKAVN